MRLINYSKKINRIIKEVEKYLTKEYKPAKVKIEVYLQNYSIDMALEEFITMNIQIVKIVSDNKTKNMLNMTLNFDFRDKLGYIVGVIVDKALEIFNGFSLVASSSLMSYNDEEDKELSEE